MKKLAKIINEQTKEVAVANEEQEDIFVKVGYEYQECEQAYNGSWYIQGYAPEKPQSIINQERVEELKKLLQETDYQAIKFAEGWLSEEEYAPIREQREAYRNEIRSLENSK